jgi:hypothetical protein
MPAWALECKPHLTGEQTMTDFDKHNLLAALIRMEHKCLGSMFKEEYEATMRLAQELQAPQFITEYFARKAITTEE